MNAAVRSSILYMVLSIVIVMVMVLLWRMKTHSLSGSHSDQEKKDAVYSKYEGYKSSSFPAVKEISARDAMEMQEKGQVIFVDVREPAEQAVSMLPGAVTRQEFLRDPTRYGNRTLVGYCTISYRSGLLAQELSRKGIEMLNLRGGLLAWVHEGGPIEDSNGVETRRVHVYSKNWNFLPQGYDAVW